MRQATTGDTVRVHYKGALADGTEFDNSAEHGPIELTIGSGQVIPGFEDALVGMAEGDTKNVTMGSDEAYGPHNPEYVHAVERTRIPAEIDLQVGTVLQTSGADGNPIRLMVVAFNDENVTLDANHPLAGKDLNFELQLVGFAA